MNYLTLQDILWIHFQITKESCSYDYASLEASTYAQYGYGQSTDLFEQACRFYYKIVLKKPFIKDNDLLATTATLCFFGINGYVCKNKDLFINSLSQKKISEVKLMLYKDKLRSLKDCISYYENNH